jgi:uncharacterized membrane protein YhiD involved in acid resistance
MMAIGDSLARGLGVFGAMAIIRFRTRIEDPRDVLFLFAALSTGLAIGVYGFTISFAGTVLFCLAAFILHRSPFRSFARNHRLTFVIPDSSQVNRARILLEHYAEDFQQVSVQLNRENEMRYEYAFSMKKDRSADQFLEDLKKIEGIKQVKIALIEFSNPQ